MVQVFNLLSLGMNELIGFFNTFLTFKKEKYSLSSCIYTKYINQFETMFFGHFLTKLQPLILNFLGKFDLVLNWQYLTCSRERERERFLDPRTNETKNEFLFLFFWRGCIFLFLVFCFFLSLPQGKCLEKEGFNIFLN